MMQEEREKELERYVAAGNTWERLPANARAAVDKVKYANLAVRYALQHRLCWRTSVAREYVADERKYYDEMVRRSRASFMMYPYHVSEELAKLLRMTPFAYYLEMMQEVMLSERSYDSIPNFTAADGVRLLGIGRNEFIDIMNKYRSKGWLFKKKKTALRELLPAATVFREPEHWWLVGAGTSPSEDELKSCDDAERATLALLEQAGPRLAGTLDKATVVSLHRRGFVFLTVPVRNTDLISVPPLENFVMNRVLGDYFENLLYDIFVSIDERTTVEQIAEVLQTDVENVKQAVSVYLLLRMAKNKSAEPILGPDGKPLPQWHESWVAQATAAAAATAAASSSPSTPPQQQGAPQTQPDLTTLLEGPKEGSKRVGFVFDSTLTAFLMMGNLGFGLKTHAVTMFEVGKLADETLDDFLAELGKVTHVAEGDAQRYADHAICLKNTIRFLRKNPACPVAGSDGGLDLLRCERLNALDKASLQRVLAKNYAVLVSMAPITADSSPVCTVMPHHFGPPIPEANSLWLKMFVRQQAHSGPACVLLVKGTRIRKIPAVLRACKTVVMHPWGHEGTVHAAGQLLPALNARLQQSPVLVEAHSYTETGRSPDVHDVPLPFVPGSTLASPNDDAVRALSQALELDKTCGYIRLAKLSGSPQWVVDHVAFGIPIFSQDLNAHVCQLTASRQLFSADSMAASREASRSMAIRLLDFIAGAQIPGYGSPDDILAAINSGNVILPSRHLVFSDGVLSTLDPL